MRQLLFITVVVSLMLTPQDSRFALLLLGSLIGLLLTLL